MGYLARCQCHICCSAYIGGVTSTKQFGNGTAGIVIVIDDSSVTGNSRSITATVNISGNCNQMVCIIISYGNYRIACNNSCSTLSAAVNASADISVHNVYGQRVAIGSRSVGGIVAGTVNVTYIPYARVGALVHVNLNGPRYVTVYV